ncbi:GNAT family N-acetyltransferase [Mesorhizobium sp. WSM4904]|uniref:GNAT family N-acetyltransferase n=1 Tax=Mesorhizobium sp. WSM4904 TaxID=3038545 RepID=UPI0024188656|nr:GNAT family N-acetyltransferase [Mesorhizobium sp. WSM4904]WFP60018.1 GNAT family N-acetyltransferase [Mesorhizobium sp. WSM4904]
MDKTTKFPISLSGYEIEGLIGTDAPRLAPLYKACSDYIELEHGQPPDPASASEEFENFPPSRTEADKFVFGLRAADDGQLVGLLACDRDYPSVGCWWIALLMIDKALRGRGLARALCDGLFTWLKSQHVQRVELGVITENVQALGFWQARGFEPIRMAGPVSIGAKQHMVQVFGRSL